MYKGRWIGGLSYLGFGLLPIISLLVLFQLLESATLWNMPAHIPLQINLLRWREISLATMSSHLFPVFIRYVTLYFKAVNCIWNEYGQYYFIQFIKISGQIYFLHLNFIILKIETVCSTVTFGNLILTSQCHPPIDKFHLKQRQTTRLKSLFNLVIF